MRCAIFALTPQGKKIAQKIAQKILLNSSDDAILFCKQEKSDATCVAFEKLKICLQENFSRYDALIFVMATGIVVRLLAPYLQNKLQDPAVLVCDEQGNFVISLLSGHVGQANELAKKIAENLCAQAVITTATDVGKKEAPDGKFAKELGLIPFPKKQIAVCNRLILEGKKICYRIDQNLGERAKFFYDTAKNFFDDVEFLKNFGELQKNFDSEKFYVVVASEEQVKNFEQKNNFKKNILWMIPRKLVAGVGCRRGTPSSEILFALEKSCEQIHQKISRVDALASAWVKRDEFGLHDAAQKLGVPIFFFEKDELQEKIQEQNLKKSAFVEKTIGVGNVCEAAAFCFAEKGRMALAKTKFQNVTVALLWQWKGLEE